MPAVADPPFHYGGLRRSITEQEELTDYPPFVKMLTLPISKRRDSTDFYLRLYFCVGQVADIIVGALQDDEGSPDRGAIHIMFMDKTP